MNTFQNSSSLLLLVITIVMFHLRQGWQESGGPDHASPQGQKDGGHGDQLGPWRAQHLPRASRHLSRILCLGPPHLTYDHRPQPNISRSYLPYERAHSGDQGPALLPLGPPDWRPFRHLGTEIFPPGYSVFYLCANSVDENQHVVVFRHDLHIRCVCRHL